MPWKDTMKMEQKIEFICEWRTGKYTITELCKCFDILRPTAYEIIARFENEGYEVFNLDLITELGNLLGNVK